MKPGVKVEAPGLQNNKFGALEITISVICTDILAGDEFPDASEPSHILSEVSKNEPNILKITSHNGLPAWAKT